MNKLFLSVFITALLAGSGAFYGGLKYAQTKNTFNRGAGNFANLTPEQRQERFGGQMRGGATRNSGLISGEILSKDEKSITVKLSDGGSKIVFYSDTTTIGKIIDGASSDLEVGKQITVVGAANGDGSLTAQSIQLRSATLPNQPKL